MKKTISTILITATVLAACSSNKKQKENLQNVEEKVETKSMPEGTHSTKIGNMELITLQDAPGSMPASLFADADSAELAKLIPSGAAEASMTAFLLKINGKNILFDSGTGATLLKKLASVGIKPEDVNDVLITHFHGDHIGGMLNEGKAVFTKADVYLPSKEIDAWLNDEALKSRNAQVKQMLDAYNMQIHKFNADDVLCEGIVARAAYGHTPGHTVFEIGNLVVFGDLLHAAAIQLKNPNLCTAYDMDKAKSVESRLKFYKYASENHKTVAGMHLPFPSVIEDFSEVWKEND